MDNRIRSLAISAKILLNLHALNNEGSDGITTIPRQVGIFSYNSKGELQFEEVSALSGDILKHFFLHNLLLLAEKLELPLSPGAKRGDARRSDSSVEFNQFIKSKPSYEEIADYFLMCSMADIAGIMLARKGLPAVGRKSTVEFGLAPALPSLQDTRFLNHTRHPTYGSYEGKKETETDPALFIVPVSSGVYSFTASMNVYQIGQNHISKTYPEEVGGIKIDRPLRFRAALTALAYSFISPRGARMTTQTPHSAVLDGFVSVSTGVHTAILQNAITGKNLLEALELAEKANRLEGPNTMKIFPFQGENQLLQTVIDILDEYEL